MTSRNRINGALAAIAVTALALSNAHAATAFNPRQLIGVNSSFYGYSASMNFDTAQDDRTVMVKQYSVGFPAGWHIAIGSVDPSTRASCADFGGLSDTDTESSAERIGYSQLTLHNDDTRNKSGPIPFSGRLYFLKYDTATATATLCSQMSTSSSLIPSASRQVLYQITIKYDVATGGVMQWNYATVPGATAGSRAIFDSPYYSTKHTSILYTRIELNTLSAGNFNKDPWGKKSAVRFVWNPDTPGNYTFTGTYTPCGAGDAGICDPTAAPAVRNTVVRITDYPTGYHPGPVLTAPALWAVTLGSGPVPVKWQQPTGVLGSDDVKGYVMTISADYVDDSTKTIYLVTDPQEVEVASPNPCGADGAAAECVFNLTVPYQSDGGQLISGNANYSMTLVAIYRDGHRSDGRCDDHTGPGADPPCADNVVPAFTATGIARTQFMHRMQAWPLVYRQIVTGNRGVAQVYILLTDLDGHRFDFIEWKPVGASYPGSGPTVSGTNALGGVIAFHQIAGPTHYHLDLAITPTSVFGLWVRTSSTNAIQNRTSLLMSKA